MPRYKQDSPSLRLTRPSRVVMLTFGGRQTSTAPAGEVFPFSFEVERNDSFVIVQSGLNHYVLEAGAVEMEG